MHRHRDGSQAPLGRLQKTQATNGHTALPKKRRPKEATTANEKTSCGMKATNRAKTMMPPMCNYE